MHATMITVGDTRKDAIEDVYEALQGAGQGIESVSEPDPEKKSVLGELRLQVFDVKL